MKNQVTVLDQQVDISDRNIVILGANGSGKTTLGQQICRQGAERISARRSIDVPDIIAMQPFAQIENEIKNQKNASINTKNYFQSDFDISMRALLAQVTEYSQSLLKEIEGGRTQFEKKDARTKLTEISELWNDLFPNRVLSFDKHQPMVLNSIRGGAAYKQNEMSDGERQCLYLAVKVLLLNEPSLIVIDEPEVHLHPSLARRLWDRLENARPKSRFIYITHDLNFAVSRQQAHIGILKEPGKIEILSNIDEIDHAVVREIIGGATTSIKAKLVYYCEGHRGSLDVRMIESWFKSDQIDVYPAGGCEDVVAIVNGFNKSQAIKGCSAKGFVDRDERCEEEVKSLESQNIFVSQVAEIEHLTILPEVIGVICDALKKEPSEKSLIIESAIEAWFNSFKNQLHIVTCKFVVDEIRWKSSFPSKKISPGENTTDSIKNISEALSATHQNFKIEEMYIKKHQELESILNSKDIAKALKVFSGKGTLKIASDKIGLKQSAYVEMFCKILQGKFDATLENNMRQALKAYFPSEN